LSDGFKDFAGREIADRGKGSKFDDDLPQGPPIHVWHDAARHRDFGGDEHAVRNGLAVTEPFVLRDRFERMASGVAVVQHPARTRFALVEFDDGRLDRA
jgi:hypothetical protein